MIGSALTLAGARSSTGDPVRDAESPDHTFSLMASFASLVDMAHLAKPAVGRMYFLREQPRQGLFECVSSSQAIADDRLQGLVIRSSDPGLVFARVWDKITGHPEWFGAEVNNGNFDCAQAIEECYRLCPRVQLTNADYFLHRTLVLNTSYRTIEGVGRWSDDQGHGTRIVLHQSAPEVETADIVRVGTSRYAGSTAALLSGNHLSNFTVVRDGICTPHRSASLASYPTGLRAAYVSHCVFKNISSLESSVGVYIGGTVYTKFDDCLSVRTKAGSSSSNDFWVGFYLDGQVNIGLAGGNASLYMSRCVVAEQSATHVNPTALLGVGAFVDTFLDNFESARIATGICFRCAGAGSYGQTIDLHIRNAVIDACGKFGIEVDLTGTANASIEIIDPYIASAGNAEIGINVHGGSGLTTVLGGQIHSGFSRGSLSLNHTSGIMVQGLKIHQSAIAVDLQEVKGMQLEPLILNSSIRSNGFAIVARSISRSVIKPTMPAGVRAGFKGGISIDGNSTHVEINGSAIDPSGFVVADPQYKVWCDGGDARQSPKFRASGNVLSGLVD